MGKATYKDLFYLPQVTQQVKILTVQDGLYLNRAAELNRSKHKAGVKKFSCTETEKSVGRKTSDTYFSLYSVFYLAASLGSSVAFFSKILMR